MPAPTLRRDSRLRRITYAVARPLRRSALLLALLLIYAAAALSATEVVSQYSTRRAEFQVTVVQDDTLSPTVTTASPAVDLRRATELGVNIAPSAGTLPVNRAAEYFENEPEVYVGTGTSRGTFEYSYDWAASGFCHRPLYFEEINLERHGYTRGILQPVISGAHFFGSIPLMPYKVVAHPPRECTYTLGHYRPGTPAPRRWHRGPFRIDAGIFEAAVVTGLVFLIP